MTKPSENMVVICNTADKDSPFDDNIEGQCNECGIPIYWRPHVPDHATKMCLGCGLILARSENADIKVTPQTINEIRDLMERGLI